MLVAISSCLLRLPRATCSAVAPSSRSHPLPVLWSGCHQAVSRRPRATDHWPGRCATRRGGPCTSIALSLLAAGPVATRGGRSVAVQAPADEVGAPVHRAQRATDAASGRGVVLVLNSQAHESHGSMLRNSAAPSRDQGPVRHATPLQVGHTGGACTRQHADGRTPFVRCANTTDSAGDSRADMKACVALACWTANLAERRGRSGACATCCAARAGLGRQRVGYDPSTRSRLRASSCAWTSGSSVSAACRPTGASSPRRWR